MEIKQLPSELRWAEKAARLLDNKFYLPGTSFRFGLDPLIGLIPLAGDAVTFVLSSAIALGIVRQGASGKVIAMMIGNILLDTIIGSIPILGHLFDFAFKANTRNIRLLKRHYEEGKYQGSGWPIVITVGIILLLLFIGILYLFYLVLKWFFQTI